MSAHVRRRPVQQSLSYHRLRDATVATRIIAATGLAPPAVVYEFGAGDGVLTAAIARRAGKVIAIERDRSLYRQLRQRFAADASVQPVFADFLAYALPGRGAYVVVANPPYSETAPLMRRILSAPNPPAGAFLVLQREAALKWTGDAGSTVSGICAQLRFTFDICLAIRRQDFRPYPRVASVLLAIRARPHPVLRRPEEAPFGAFVARGFGRYRGNRRRNLGPSMSGSAYLAAARELGFAQDAAPSELTFEQWLGLWLRSRR